ncbi:isoprenylcysteine carboxyl methyltransferase family protein [Bacillus sp. T33-2]|uniref:isoprenylcysteine carboxyl methyltransferase family protein n=1 Tax=Bacillus sp. T33-2 TaxID=2054168 RepID=UPI000C75C2F5|nr:isoprenylcysteine carboxylmethyltransferase family protein [Bacillus sp. T33-2]PLR99690.1 hypothetical protein CVD19_01105 [Bacillus sp. T33-2]
MAFYIFIGFIISQRLVELIIAKRNERWMKKNGALEFGAAHYKAIVVVHAAFFISFAVEHYYFERGISGFWPVLLLIFLATQALRTWALLSLGRYWNTKIIVLPGAEIVRRGPYRFIRHPNYVIVTIEFIIIPLLFNAFITAAVFSIMNLVILSIRIPAEEKALNELTRYVAEFKGSGRFVPNLLNKYDN